MTIETRQLKTRSVTVEIEQTDTNNKKETQSIHIRILDNETRKTLKHFQLMESADLKQVWLSEIDTLKRL